MVERGLIILSCIFPYEEPYLRFDYGMGVPLIVEGYLDILIYRNLKYYPSLEDRAL